jgi:hypothetical protein
VKVLLGIFLWQPRRRGKSKLLVFVSKQCSICGVVREGAIRLSESWRKDSEIFLLYDCHPAEHETDFALIRSGLQEKRDQNLKVQLGITFVPFAVVVDMDGLVVGKGLVNEISHLESLLELERAARKAKQSASLAPASAMEAMVTDART